MKIAVVHDYFTQLGGAEKVAEELHSMLPNADLFATVALPDRMPGALKNVEVKTSWMQNLPKMREYYRIYFLLYPLAVSSLDLSSYDLVVSSSSGYAKGVRAGRDSVHVCYCHTPMRWVWSYDDYSARESFGLGQRIFLPKLLSALRSWDIQASREPDHFIANSRAVAARIKRAYGRTAEVIFPPVDVNRFRISQESDDYYVVLARLIPYKRIDLAVKACTLLGRNLMVLGTGPDRASLEAMAGPTVKFLGRVSDREVEHYVSRCRALLFPGEEDFGLAPVEVASAGRPTIAFRAGGAIETIVEGVTGAFFDQQTPECLAAAIERFEKQEWEPGVIRSHAEGFSAEVFEQRFRGFLNRIGIPLNAAHTNFAPRLTEVKSQGNMVRIKPRKLV